MHLPTLGFPPTGGCVTDFANIYAPWWWLQILPT